MKPPISKPINPTQIAFNKLCENGGGQKGGPPRSSTIALLKSSGRDLNRLATGEIADHMAKLPGRNPWHICFAIGMSWGHLAQLHSGFTAAVCNVLENWNASDLKEAASYHMERGRMPIEQSLMGAYNLFSRVKLPEELPDDLVRLARAQERWLSPINNPKERPPYIGAWNATAMFMAALFAQPGLAATHKDASPTLPPAGPIYRGLMLLHQAGILSKKPSGGDLDDAGFEPGIIYENNGLLAELCKNDAELCMIDIHSGVYMLGTRHPLSASWAAGRGA